MEQGGLRPLNESIQEARRKFAPTGVVKEDARRIADWSVFFFGDKEQSGHYHIRGKVPQFHIEIYEDLMSNWKLYYISAPSEFSKTTICTLIYPLYRIIYFSEPYTMVSSRVDDTAVELLDEIKNEISDNDKLIEYYGSLKGDSSYAWSDHFIELVNGSKVRAVGWGGNVRARKRGGYRITLFIGDDPEEVADMSSKQILKTHIQWLKRTVVPRMDKEFGKVRVVGTMIGLRGTMDNLQHDPRWRGRVYKALVPDDIHISQRHSIWEERWPTKDLQNERRAAIRAGELEYFMFERMNEPVASLVKNLKGYRFWDGEFQRHNEQNLIHLTGYLDPIPVYTYCAIDPAFSQAESADERAIVTFAMGYLPTERVQKTCIWVLEYDFNHMDPDQIIERALDLHKKYFYRELVIETVAGQKIYEFIATKSLQGDPFLINYPLNPNYINYQPRNKEDRIYTYFKTITKLGQLYIRSNMEELREELDYFLQSKHLHLLDALEMGCRYSVPCNENVNYISPKSRYYKETHRDRVKERLEAEGRGFLLY